MEKQGKTQSNKHWALWFLGILAFGVGAFMCFPGIYLITLGGSWYYALMGAFLMVIGIMIFRGDVRGVYLYFIAFTITVIWAIWDVHTLDQWFWPLVPRLFAFMVALWLLLLGIRKFPNVREKGEWRGRIRAARWVSGLSLVVFFGLMFMKHGVIQNDYIPNPNASAMKASADMGEEWRHYGRTNNGTRFYPGEQITTDNVKDLEVAWTYRFESEGYADNADQHTPVFANDTLYSCTYNNEIHAIGPISGQRKWVYNPQAEGPFFMRCRGVTYYETRANADGACSKRVVTGTVDARLIAVDADTGKPCSDFGEDGQVDLMEGMGEYPPGYYFQTSAPTVSKGRIIVGGLVVDNNSVGEPSGVVRAFDGETGELVWAWDVGRPGETDLPPQGQTYTKGTPNVWTHMAVDEDLGLVYLPTGNATPDMGTAHRRDFDNEYASSVVAVDIDTGLDVWHYQTTHLDAWDYDLPAQPSLYDIKDPNTGENIPALLQPTKRGQLFLLNRETGEPIAEVEEREVSLEGLMDGFGPLSETQPYSVGMPTIGAEPVTEQQMWGITPMDQVWCRISYRQLRYAGNEFTVPNEEPFLTYPGAQGGMNWGAAAIDENRGLAIVNDLRLPIITQLLPADTGPIFDHLSSPHELIAPQKGTPWEIERSVFGSPLGLLCGQPPYGTISAVDLNTKELVWSRPIGTIRNLDFMNVTTGLNIPIGMPTLGGSVVTGSGLIFFGSAMDHYFRALDVETGDTIWKDKMPVGANATPISYKGEDGRQYVVISAGGATYAAPEKRGDYLIGYALPDAGERPVGNANTGEGGH